MREITKKIYFPLVLALLVINIGMSGCSISTKDEDVLFQTSMYSVLSEGDYDGDVAYEDLRQHGDFGIGTFDNLDGEMIALGDKFYQIKTDGKAYPVDNSMETPFAIVTFFEADKAASLDDVADYEQLKQHLDSLLPGRDIFYAIKIDGYFEYMKARSVPAQNKPYPSLDEALKGQTVFEFHDVSGTLVGFWCPDYIAGLNVPGYHFHFITADRKVGGHMLDCWIQSATAEIDYTSAFYMAVSESD
ncbi:MAG: acetolactate decarboxylase [Dehalococcoidia bacterium]|nr:acetolactate decarboxylase [Dehalococcoidia bacterium]